MSSAEIPDFVSMGDYLSMEERALTKSEYIDSALRQVVGHQPPLPTLGEANVGRTV
jgi:hypothetical protein